MSSKNPNENVSTSGSASAGSHGDPNLERFLAEGAKLGQFPLKLVTGHQETTGLNFDLKPGAIVAHPGSTVVFVCG